jgi:formylglycine-generating enzyme
MAWVPGGLFCMGSNAAYADEGPEHLVEVSGFWIDRFPVTNERFAAFVAATGHKTCAEVASIACESPRNGAGRTQAGSLVFVKPDHPVPSRDSSRWWHYVPGADWRHPTGPDSSLLGLAQHPVVHVAYADALAYAAWRGMQLPTEAEWEYASRGGLDGATYAWGEVLMPDGKQMANYWQGHFPEENTSSDGWERTSPVGTYPANGYGLYDMIGNTWEWTSDWYRPRHIARQGPLGRHPVDPHGPVAAEGADHRPGLPRLRRKVLKGGSHLCDVNHSHRYRPAARMPAMTAASTSDISFRCVVRP